MTAPRVFEITPRQREVLDVLMDAGASEQQIGKRLGISEHTVGSHMRRIYRAAEVNSRDELIVGLFRRRLMFRVVNKRSLT